MQVIFPYDRECTPPHFQAIEEFGGAFLLQLFGLGSTYLRSSAWYHCASSCHLQGRLLRSDFTLLRRHIGLPRFLFSLPLTSKPVYDMICWLLSCMIQSEVLSCMIESDGCSCTISISEPHLLQYLVLGELRSPST